MGNCIKARKSYTAEQGQHAAWTKQNVPERRATWRELWRVEPIWIPVLLRITKHILPSPLNLLKWNLLEPSDLQLCCEHICLVASWHVSSMTLIEPTYQSLTTKTQCKLQETITKVFRIGEIVRTSFESNVQLVLRFNMA